jgi:chemotaxis protein histidine kinase CheA
VGAAGQSCDLVEMELHGMGGDVTVASEPGKGSVFTVRLPGGDALTEAP